MPTISVENYLKAIYHLDPLGESLVKNKAIAERLEISLPSVTAMLKSLSDEELVSYTRYKGVSLTPEGRSQALKVIRKHRLIELFLVNTLDYSWDEVHIEAERLEHAVSEDLASRIEEFLGHPRVDPHGDPIPTADGQVLSSHAIPLSQCVPPCSLSVERVLDQSPDLLRYLKGLHIMPGEIIEVTHIQDFDGQVSLRTTTGSSDTVITLTQTTASRILVAAVSS